MLFRSEIDQASDTGLLQDLDIKVVGYFRCAKAAVPHMRKNQYGRIINIGGLTGRGSKQLSGMRNVAVVHMTKCLSDQLGPDGITANDLAAAFQIEDQARIGFWDALIIAVAVRAGARRLVSEDLNAGQSIAGLTIHNPFKERPKARLRR